MAKVGRNDPCPCGSGKLDTEMLKILKTYPDPALREAMEGWRSEADKEFLI